MNQLEQFRDVCAQAVEVHVKKDQYAYADECPEIIRALPLPEDQTEALRKENEKMREALQEIHSWIVCGGIATPEDMAQNFPIIEKLCAEVLGVK